MKKFTITRGMLGSKEIVSILTTPIPESILNALMAEMAENVRLDQPIQHFLMDLSIVSSMLKKNKTDNITSVHVEMALANGQQLPQKVQRLIGPQIYALMEIAPRLNILSEIKTYLDTYVFEYMQTRCRDSHPDVLEATAFMLDTMDVAEETVSDVEVRDVTSILRAALRALSAPLYHSNQSSLFRRAPQLDGHDIITKEAFDTILNDGTQEWSLFDPDSLRSLIDLAMELGYKDSEVWALKVLFIRKICDIIHWRHLAGFTIDLKEWIDFLLYAQELDEEVRDYSSDEKNKHVSTILWTILHRLNMAEQEIYSECEEEETAMEYLRKKERNKQTKKKSENLTRHALLII